MSERGLPIADGASACPFVAFEDDRDERAPLPDHRHRCYAEVRPAPRALAHQEAYCLSSAFPVCPTFQDWARREAARARSVAADASAAADSAASAGATASLGGDPEPDPPSMPVPPAAPPPAGAGLPPLDSGEGLRGDEEDSFEDGPHRNPPRDWAAPPPWMASSEAAGGRGPGGDPPDFLSRRSSEPGAGLAGSAADLLAGGSPPRPEPPPAPPPVAPRPPARERRSDEEGDDEEDLPRVAPPARRPRAYDQHLGGTDGPDWERPRRYEAYPTIRTRMSLPSIPRLGLMAGAIALAAIALFFLPALLGVGGEEEPGATASPSVLPTPSSEPTPAPLPTPVVYIVKPGDNLSSIARQFSLTLEQIMAANPDITDPNLITEGQQIVIPVPSPPPDDLGGSPSTSAAPAP